jgi:diguanylate cyclase (GGDEF)-like protein
MVQTINDRTEELKLANEQLIFLSVQDGLTGIANRRMFDSYMRKEWRRAMREQSPLSVVMLDVDFFKGYNDTYGHQQGDRCLVAVATALQQNVRRPADLAARYGGEEFVLVLPNTPAEGAMLLAERVREGVQALKIEHRASTVSPFVSVSLGVVTAVPSVNENGAGLDAFLEAADQGLYLAKHQGRNRAVSAVYNPGSLSPTATDAASAG